MASTPIDQAERSRAIHELETTFLVEAAAGTGKTTLAIERILQAVRSGHATMEQIVAITFTEKAAGELKIRLRDSMERARREARGEERQRLEGGVRQLERSHINTIHGFCSWLLKERPVEAGVDPGFQVLDALGTQLLQEEIWVEWFDQQMGQRPEVLKRAWFAEMSPEQLRDIAFELVDKRDRVDLASLKQSDYSLANAVAEFGAILARLKPKLANCKDTRDAAHQTVTQLLGLSTALREMKPYRQEFELMHSVRVDRRSGNKSNWADADSLKTIKEAYDSLKAIPLKRADALLCDVAAWLKGFVAAYERVKALRGALDFDDLLIRTRALLLTNPVVRADFQRRFRLLLVDEFQDTDPVQTAIVFLLAEEGAKATRWDEVRLQPGKLFLVGDPKQSIYRFRRADIEMYEAAKKLVQQQGEVLHIRQSFRTTSSLIAWINFTFEQLIHPPEGGAAYQPGYVPLHESPERHSKMPRLCVLEPTAEQRAAIEEGNIHMLRHTEAHEVARLIDHLVQSAEWEIRGRDDPKPRPPRYRDFAVLLHSPQTSLSAYEAALQQQAVPYQVDGGKDYFQSQEVRAVCALLLALDDPMNTRELVGVLRSTVFGFSDEEIFSWAREKTLSYLDVEALVPSAATRDPALHRSTATSIGDALTVLRQLHDQRNQHSFAGFLELIYHELTLLEGFSLKPQGQQRVANLTKLPAIARRVQAAGLLSLREFVDYLRTTALDRSEEGQSPSAEANDDVVSVVSIHKAKGLEWSVVIVGDLGGEKRSRPPMLLATRDSQRIGLRLHKNVETANYEELKHQEELRQRAEEKRLLYVAATRARDYLVLPWFAAKGHYLDVIKTAFDPTHVGQAVSMFFRRDGEHGRLAPSRHLQPIRVELGEPPSSQRARIEGLTAQRADWITAHEALLARANDGRTCIMPSRLAEAKGGEGTSGRMGERATEAEPARLLGTVMHEALAQLDFQKPGDSVALWRACAARGGLSDAQAKRGEEMLRTLAETELFARISRAEAVHREVPFAYRKGDVTMEGVMDLVFKEGDQWFLVDYKTDRVGQYEAASHAERYRPQLEAYAEALRTIGGIKAAKILMFLWSGREVCWG